SGGWLGGGGGGLGATGGASAPAPLATLASGGSVGGLAALVRASPRSARPRMGSDPQWRHRVDRPPRHRRAVRGRHRYYAPALRNRRLRLAISVATSLAADSSSAIVGG